MKAFKAAFLLVFAVLSAGCWNSADIQSQIYATTIGLDYANGQYIAYAQILNFANIAKLESMEIGKKVPIWIGKGKGTTVADALTSITSAAPLPMFWGHVKTIVVSERLIRKGLPDVYDAINRYREVRYNITLFGTKENLVEIFKQNSIINFSPIDSLLTKPEKSYTQYSFIPPQQGFKFIAHLNETGTMLPSLSMTRHDWKEDQDDRTMLLVDGAYVFDHLRYAAWMSRQELIGARWMQRRLKQGMTTVPHNSHPASSIILKKPRLRIDTTMQGGDVLFDVKLKLTADVLELRKDATDRYIEEVAEQMIENEIRTTFRNGVAKGCDVYQLGEVLYRRHPHAWKRLVRDGKLPLRGDSLRRVDVDVKIEHSGKYKMLR